MPKQLNSDALPYEPKIQHKKAPPPAVAMLVSPPPMIYQVPYYYTYQQFYNITEEFAHFYSYNTKAQPQPQPYSVSLKPTGGQYAVVFGGGEKKLVETYKVSAVKKNNDDRPTKFGGGRRWKVDGGRVRRCGAQWKPKSFKSGAAGGDAFKTTVMIKNIPNQFRRKMLVEFLDKLCEDTMMEYDFVYLPMDFVRQNNYGYAFVNFTSPSAARRIRELLQGYKWGYIQTDCGSTFLSHKICEITWAKIQGKDALIRNFENSAFGCGTSEWLPVVFSPARNGFSSTGKQRTIGKCKAPSS